MRQSRSGNCGESIKEVEKSSGRIPIRRERQRQYALDVSVKDHCCSARSQVPDTANCIETTMKCREYGIIKTQSRLRRSSKSAVILEFDSVNLSGVTFLK